MEKSSAYFVQFSFCCNLFRHKKGQYSALCVFVRGCVEVRQSFTQTVYEPTVQQRKHPPLCASLSPHVRPGKHPPLPLFLRNVLQRLCSSSVCVCVPSTISLDRSLMLNLCVLGVTGALNDVRALISLLCLHSFSTSNTLRPNNTVILRCVSACYV